MPDKMQLEISFKHKRQGEECDEIRWEKKQGPCKKQGKEEKTGQNHIQQ